MAVALYCGDHWVGRGRLGSVEVTMWDTGSFRLGVGLADLAAPVYCTTDEEQTPDCLQTLDGIID